MLELTSVCHLSSSARKKINNYSVHRCDTKATRSHASTRAATSVISYASNHTSSDQAPSKSRPSRGIRNPLRQKETTLINTINPITIAPRTNHASINTSYDHLNLVCSPRHLPRPP